MWGRVIVKAKPALLPVTLGEVKGWLAIDFADHDAMLNLMIGAAVSMIDGPGAYGIALMQQDWQISYPDFRNPIIAPGWPVKSVVSLSHLDASGSTVVVPEANYRAILDEEPVRVLPARGQSWPVTLSEPGAVKIAYRLGEAQPDQVDPQLRRAVLMLVAHFYTNREAASEVQQVVPFGIEEILREYQRGAAS